MPDISEYLQRITSEYSNQPNFVATIAAMAQPFADIQASLAQLITAFGLDTAVGQQLDYTGEWVGLTRFVDEPVATIFFSWDVPGAGWDQADWAPLVPVVNPSARVVLADPDYRNLLRARVLANTWDGSKNGAYAAWNQLLNARGFQVLIQEVIPHGQRFFSWDTPGAGWDESVWFTASAGTWFAFNNMHIVLMLWGTGPVDALTEALFVGGYLELKPAGVSAEFGIQSVPGAPIFAFDCDTPYLAGWDKGAWLTDVTPGGG